MSSYTHFRAVFILFLLAELIIPSTVHFNANNESAIFIPLTARAALQSSNIRIKEINPVVNQGNQIKLTAVDSNGQELNDATFESGSADIASVDPKTGTVTGVQRGFATVTARRGNDSFSTFVVVARVESNRGAKVSGDTKTDTGGRIYISDPTGNVILRKDGTAEAANLFAGSKDVRGRRDGNRTEALFAGPTGVAVDNSAFGGIYVADTLNHSIRKIGFNNQVATILGAGSPGITAALMSNDAVKFTKPEDVFFSSLRGVATDSGGNLFIADTDNHAVYFVDFMKSEVHLLAGQPGASGKTDGKGRAARFNRPAGIALKSNGKILAVADEGNNRVRLITRDGDVTTVGRATSSNRVMEGRLDLQQAADDNEFNFAEPQSVSFDGVGNIYVIDKSGAQAQIITFPSNQTAQVLSLAQTGTFNQAASIVVSGTQTFVLDNNATSDADAVKTVTVGAPEIASLSRDSDRLEGGAEVVINGKNFAPESQVVLGDKTVTDAVVETATRIRLPRVPPQNAPGNRTLSVQTRGGTAQRVFSITAKPISELADGEITTIAGGVRFLGDGGRATSANFSFPVGVTIDGVGNLFIADQLHNRIRRVNASGIITTVAGNGISEFSGDSGPAVSAGLSTPQSVALDGAGNLFISDAGNSRIRRVDANTGVITTVAGGGTGEDGGPAVSAGLNIPASVAVDGSGNLFIADVGNNRIRRVDAKTGVITTVAGNGSFGFSGDGSQAVSAGLFLVSEDVFGNIALDRAGHMFIADVGNNRIRRVDAKTGVITTVAGNGSFGFSGDGGPAVSAGLSDPTSVALDRSGNLFIADANNNRIRRVDASGIIITVAGNGKREFSGDGGQAVRAGLRLPISVALDGADNLFISDNNNFRIRQVNARTGVITTTAGADVSIGDNGPAISASLRPDAVAIDGADNLFIADFDNSRIRRVDAGTGVITTVAGNGSFSFSGDGGPAVSAGLNGPVGVALDRSGNLFIADVRNFRIRRVDARTGIIATTAGNGRRDFSGDGGPAVRAALGITVDVAADAAGNSFIADFDNSRIRRVDAGTGVITTVAGNGSFSFSGDGGLAVSAGLRFPTSVALDRSGNLFIADNYN